jgi:hypothetical protein
MEPERKAPERTPYTRPTDAPAPLEFWVDTPHGSVLTRARSFSIFEWLALDDHLIGEIKSEADTTGESRKKECVIRLKHSVLSVDHPEWQGDAEKFYRLPGNDLLAFMTWDQLDREVKGALAAPRTKSGAEGDGDAPGEGVVAAGAGGEGHS